MEIEITYSNLAERQILVDENEAEGYRMLHDNFDSNWKKGDEPHGTMIFTDKVALMAPEPRDLLAEIDELKARLDKITKK